MDEQKQAAETNKKDAKANPEKKKRGPMFIPMCIGVAGFLGLMASAPFWATDAAEARRVLIANGYRPIKVGGFDPFGCGLDLYATKFTAVSPRGIKIKGNVCKTPHVSEPTVEEGDPLEGQVVPE